MLDTIENKIKLAITTAAMAEQSPRELTQQRSYFANGKLSVKRPGQSKSALGNYNDTWAHKRTASIGEIESPMQTSVKKVSNFHKRANS